MLICVIAVMALFAATMVAQDSRPERRTDRLTTGLTRLDDGNGNGSLLVRVVDQTGQAIQGLVHVEISRRQESRGHSALQDGYCDSSGYFTFNGLTRGDYTVSVTVPGFPATRYEVEITRDEQESLTIQLRRIQAVSGAGAEDGTISVQQLGVPEKARKRYDKACELYDHKDYKGAVKQLREALQADPVYVVAENKLGLAYFHLGQPNDARQQFETAIRTDAKFLLPYLNLAGLLAEQKDYQHAAEVLEECSKQQPARGEPYYEMARILLAAGNVEQAKSVAQAALAHDVSRVPEVHLVLANVDLRLQQQEDAAKHMQDYLAAAPNGPYAALVREQLQKIQHHTN